MVHRVVIQWRQQYFIDKLCSKKQEGIWNNLKVRQFVNWWKDITSPSIADSMVCGKQPCERADIKYLSQIAIFIINIHKPSLLFFRLWNITFCNYSTVKLKETIKSLPVRIPFRGHERQEKNTLFVSNIFMLNKVSFPLLIGWCVFPYANICARSFEEPVYTFCCWTVIHIFWWLYLLEICLISSISKFNSV